MPDRSEIIVEELFESLFSLAPTTARKQFEFGVDQARVAVPDDELDS